MRIVPYLKKLFVFGVTLLLLIVIAGAWLAFDAEKRYEAQMPTIMFDRNGIPLHISENNKGHYLVPLTELPEDFVALLLRKEDRFFQFHPGINPISTLRAVIHYITAGDAGGSSTITQQLAKNLLGTETHRTIFNKAIEAAYAISLDIFLSKDEILIWYANTVYLGNQTQGFESASIAYFGKPLRQTSHSEKISLLSTLSYPSARNPWEPENSEHAESLNKRIAPTEPFTTPDTTDSYSFQQDSYFELRTSGVSCTEQCTTTIDDSLTNAIRSILNDHIQRGRSRNVRNGAVVVLDAHSLETLALVGSHDPNSTREGNQINMTLRPRPIGSTVKPFIYTKGFSLGLRPYTVVEDREYKYPIASGYALYPKNYDGQYRGEVTLHEALSNSLNVPTVKVLEFVGLEEFYSFLENDLRFLPIQDLDEYQYGIALGGLEMDLLTLTHYFSVFPNQGTIQPLRVFKSPEQPLLAVPQSHITKSTQIIEPEYIELANKILSDRLRGVNQFGLVSNLNIPDLHYGVKTGTSRDYHDSWVVGYTPDFIVGVWLGNVENEALLQVSGQTGAGAVWHDVMQVMAESPYNLHSDFPSHYAVNHSIGNSMEWGLASDDVAKHAALLSNDYLITSLHTDDSFELSNHLNIPLTARTSVDWFINGDFFEHSSHTNYSPLGPGVIEVTAVEPVSQQREIVSITVTSPQ